MARSGQFRSPPTASSMQLEVRTERSSCGKLAKSHTVCGVERNTRLWQTRRAARAIRKRSSSNSWTGAISHMTRVSLLLQ
jgi:hypothetical protein